VPVGNDAALIVGDPTSIVDGETLTLDDGNNPPINFEFECPTCAGPATPGVSGSNVPVVFDGTFFDGLGDDAAEYRDLGSSPSCW